MRVAFILLPVLYTSQVFSQDITGIWRGSFNASDADSRLNDIFGIQDRYKFEVQVDQQGKQFKGVTYSYKTTVFYGKATARGTVNPKTQKVLLEEIKILEMKMGSSEFPCIMTCFLQYAKNGKDETLEGKYSSYRISDSSFCGRGSVVLQKVTTSDFKKEPFLVKRSLDEQKKQSSIYKPNTTSSAKKPTTPIAKNNLLAQSTLKPVTSLKIPDKEKEVKIDIPQVLKTRENKLARTISVNSNVVTINIYDNGVIDHDTVSVYIDKKLVASKRMLKTTPISFTIPMDANDNNYHEVVMVAENLGDIPPNTALMVVKAGDKEYEVHITSTEQRNAVVAFRYEDN